jgi:hypothetical protein
LFPLGRGMANSMVRKTSGLVRGGVRRPRPKLRRTHSAWACSLPPPRAGHRRGGFCVAGSRTSPSPSPSVELALLGPGRGRSVRAIRYRSFEIKAAGARGRELRDRTQFRPDAKTARPNPISPGRQNCATEPNFGRTPKLRDRSQSQVGRRAEDRGRRTDLAKQTRLPAVDQNCATEANPR